MKLGQKLKEARLNAGLKQEELAKQLGVSRQTISSWENDRSYPDLGSAVKLSNLYGRSMDEMLRSDDAVLNAFEDLAKRRKRRCQTLVEIAVIMQLLGLMMYGLGFGAFCYAIVIAGTAVFYLSVAMHLRFFDHTRKEILAGIAGITLHCGYWLLRLIYPPFFENNFYLLIWIWGIWGLLRYAGVLWQLDTKSTRLWLIIALMIAVFLFPFLKMAKPVEENTTADPFVGTYLVEEVLVPAEGMGTENTRVVLNRVWGKEPYMTIYETDERYPINEDQDYFHFVDPAPGTGQLGTWQMVPASDETLAYWITVEGDGSVLLSLYQNNTLQWQWKLIVDDPVIASVSVQTWGATGVKTLDFYAPEDPDPQPNFSKQTSVNGKGTMKIALSHPESDTLTLTEEYHHGDAVESAIYTLEPGKSGSFAMDLKTRYDGKEEWALYRIPYQDGEYRFILTFGK